MKRNFLLFVAVCIGLILVVNSAKRLVTFRSTALQVKDAHERLETLKQENEVLERELEYKKSKDFAEGEIRNKLNLVKEGETVVIVPKEESRDQNQETGDQKAAPNWQKWWKLFFGT